MLPFIKISLKGYPKKTEILSFVSLTKMWEKNNLFLKHLGVQKNAERKCPMCGKIFGLHILDFIITELTLLPINWWHHLQLKTT